MWPTVFWLARHQNTISWCNWWIQVERYYQQQLGIDWFFFQCCVLPSSIVSLRYISISCTNVNHVIILHTYFCLEGFPWDLFFSNEHWVHGFFRGVEKPSLLNDSQSLLLVGCFCPLQDWSCRPRWQASHLRIDRLRFGFRGGPHGPKHIMRWNGGRFVITRKKVLVLSFNQRETVFSQALTEVAPRDISWHYQINIVNIPQQWYRVFERLFGEFVIAAAVISQFLQSETQGHISSLPCRDGGQLPPFLLG